MATIRLPNVPAAVAAPAERAFAALSAARGRRIFHPQGLAFRGRLRVDAGVAGVPVLAPGAEHPLVLRFSRALGMPRGRPDFLGLALRIGTTQDVLLASSAAAPVLRYVPVPARTFAGTTFSSLLPYEAAGRLVLVGARVEHVQAAADDALVQLAAAAALAPVRVTVALAAVGGRWRTVASAEVGERLPDAEAAALAFDPWVCDGGLVPWGPANAVRAPAYRGSRRGRGVAGPPAVGRGARSAPR